MAQGRRLLLILCARHFEAARESERSFCPPIPSLVLSAEERAEFFYRRELPADEDALVRWAKEAAQLGLRPEDSKSYRKDRDARVRIEREPRRGETRPWRPSLIFTARRKGSVSPREPAADVLILARDLFDRNFLDYLKDKFGEETVKDWTRQLEGEVRRNPKSGKRVWRGGVPGLKRRLRLASKGHADQGRPRLSKDKLPRSRRARDAELYAEIDRVLQRAKEEERDCATRENRPPRTRGLRKHVLSSVNAIESDAALLRGYYRWLARQRQ